MIQKIIQVGNSLAITIPNDFAEQVDYKKGDKVVVETNKASKMLLVKPQHLSDKKSLTPEFYEWLNEISEKYEDVIKELAHR